MQFEEDTTFGGSAYLSDVESSDPEFCNEAKILADEVSVSAKKSEVIRHAELEASKENDTKPDSTRKIQEFSIVTLKKPENKILKSDTEDCSLDAPIEEKTSRIAQVVQNELRQSLGSVERKSISTGYIVYAQNPRVNDANYINVAIGIFLTVAIIGEIVFGLVT